MASRARARPADVVGARDVLREEPRRIDEPEPGYFKIRLVRKGPWVPARIRHEPIPCPDTGQPLDRSYLWHAEIAGIHHAPPDRDPARAGVFRIWLFGKRITEDEYRKLRDKKDQAERHDPQAPELTPEQPVDLGRMKPLF